MAAQTIFASLPTDQPKVALMYNIISNLTTQYMTHGTTQVSAQLSDIEDLGIESLDLIKQAALGITGTPFVSIINCATRLVTFTAMPSTGSVALGGAAASTTQRVPRPKNAFVIFRLDNHHKVRAQNPGLHNNDISKLIGGMWREAPQSVKDDYKKRAEDEKRQHAIAHPGYQYQPRKPSEKKKRMTKRKLAKLATQSGDTSASTVAASLPVQQATDNITMPLYHNNTSPITMPLGDEDDAWAAFSFDDNVHSALFHSFAPSAASTGEDPRMSGPYAEQFRQDQLESELSANLGLDTASSPGSSSFSLDDLLNMNAQGGLELVEDPTNAFLVAFDA